tara:strand:- start:229 stop:480 length:252 start_codon:yes stop_codon:yes gene_type:complete
MGWLLKAILFFVVFSWIFRTVSKFLLGSFVKQAQQKQAQQHQQARPPDGNVNVKFSAKNKSKDEKTSDDFKGGDYVDYEELKD